MCIRDRATAIKAGSLDRIFLVNILHESKEPNKILAEALRLLKSKAKLIIVDWKRVASPFGPTKEKKLDKVQLINNAKRLGFLPEEEFEAGKYHFGLILTKI